MTKGYMLDESSLRLLRRVVREVLGEQGRSADMHRPGQTFDKTQIKLGKTQSEIAKGQTGLVDVYVRRQGKAKGEEEPADYAIDNAYSRWGDVPADTWVLLIALHGGWEIIQADACDQTGGA